MSSSRPNPKAICILILEILLCITVYLLCVCLRRRRRRPAAVHATVMISTTTNHPPPRGLDPAVVASFPIIPYAAVSDFAGGPHRRPSPELDCAVCLSAFQEDETLRFIPKCEHVFHPHCVDPWLALHTTCPYCRASLGPGPADSDRPENSSNGEVVIQVTVTNGVSGESTVSPECGRYTLRLSHEIWRNFVPGNGGRVADRSFPPEKDVRR